MSREMLIEIEESGGTKLDLGFLFEPQLPHDLSMVFTRGPFLGRSVRFSLGHYPMPPLAAVNGIVFLLGTDNRFFLFVH